jgi:hypothetical protein
MSMIGIVHRQIAMMIGIILCVCTAPSQAQPSDSPAQRGHVLVVPQGRMGGVVDRFVSTTGGAEKESTTAAVKWDAEALTVVFTCEDAEIVATHTDRDDANMWQDDSVEVFLDPGHSHDILSPWFHVTASVAGGVSDEQGPATAWYSTGAVVSGNAKFDARQLKADVQRTPTGWTATIRITWSDLGRKPNVGEVWGFNLNRASHPAGEYVCYSPTQGPFYNIHQWGHLVFADSDGKLGDITREQLLKQLDASHDAIDIRSRTVGGVTYEKLDPGAPFTPAPVAPQNWQAPEPTAAERDAGMLAYVTEDPGEYKPDRIPKATEHARKLTAFLTPGEDEPVWFGVRGLANLERLTVTVDMGHTPLKVDTRHMHFWPQRAEWRGHQWYMTPELLLPLADGTKQVPTQRGVLATRPFDVKVDETAAFWLTLTAHPDTRPGIYKGSVRIRAANRDTLTLPLEVEVLPFKLRRPTDRHWTLYADQQRWATMSDEQVMAELRDFARHGITGLNSIGLGSADLSDIKNGKVSFDASSYRRITSMAAEAGIPGPHVVRAWYAEAVRDAVAPGVDLQKGDWPQSVKDGVAAVARAAVEATRDMPAWHFYGIDEPRGDNTFAIQDYQAWHAGGASTYATVIDTAFLEKAASALTVPCFGSPFVVDEQTRALRERVLNSGAEYWWYGTGCYVNPYPQEAMLAANRLGGGLLFWKSGAKGQAIWTFMRAHDDVFNDFDGIDVNRLEPKEQCIAYPHLLAPDDWRTYQGAIPTIAWEALREGADEYAYLHTLQFAIDRVRQHDDNAVAAEGEKSQAWLDKQMQAVPWADTMGTPDYSTSQMQALRRQIAEEIIRLIAIVQDAPPSRNAR